MVKREKTPLEKMSTRELLQRIRQDLKRKMEEIGFEPAEASIEKNPKPKKK